MSVRDRREVFLLDRGLTSGKRSLYYGSASWNFVLFHCEEPGNHRFVNRIKFPYRDRKIKEILILISGKNWQKVDNKESNKWFTLIIE